MKLSRLTTGSFRRFLKSCWGDIIGYFDKSSRTKTTLRNLLLKHSENQYEINRIICCILFIKNKLELFLDDIVRQLRYMLELDVNLLSVIWCPARLSLIQIEELLGLGCLVLYRSKKVCDNWYEWNSDLYLALSYCVPYWWQDGCRLPEFISLYLFVLNILFLDTSEDFF